LSEQGEQAADMPPPPEALTHESPREFIHRKMQQEAISRPAQSKNRNRKPRG
jgi:hypothetical protein